MSAGVRWRAERRVAVAAGLLIYLLAPPSVRAAGADEAEALVRHGVELRKQGKDREALAEFERARAFGETPRLTAQIGLAQFALGQWLLADDNLTKALEHTDDPWIDRHRAALSDAVGKVGARLGSVEIWGEPAGAQVLVNGKPAGALPSPPTVRVVAGSCSVVVRAEGYQDVTRELAVPPKGRVREYVELVRLPGPAQAAAPHPAQRPLPAAVPPPASDGDTAVGGTLTRSGPPAEDNESHSVLTRWWFWTAIGVVAAGAVTAYVLTAPKLLDCPRGTTCY